MFTLYISNGNSSLTTQKNGLLKQVWSLFSFDNRPRLNGRAVFPHSAILFYSIFLCPAPVFTNLKIVENSDTKDILSPGRYIFIHVGVLPFLPLLVPTHHNQQGREGEGEGEHGNFHLSFKVQDIFHKRTRNADLTKCCQQCLLDENCRYNVENSSEQRLPVNNLLRSHLYPKNLP